MSQQVGQKLIQAREAQSLSLEKVAQETHIRLHYLRALEAGELETLPSDAQVRGFLRAYAGYLGLDPDPLIAEIRGASVAANGSEDAPAASSSPAPAPPAGEAAEIFSQLGEQLREQRERLGFSLEDVEQHTHLRVHYLQALEDGRIGDLPSPVQGRGMLSNYASFLGLDSDPLLLRFADGLQAQLASRQAAATSPSSRRGFASPRWLRKVISGDLLFGTILIAGFVIFVIWAAIRVTSLRASEAVEPTPPSLAGVLQPSPTAAPTLPTPTATSADVGAVIQTPQAVVTETVVPVGEAEGAVQVYVVVHQRAWMQVLEDGQVAFEGRVIPGSAYPFAGDDRVEILTGNGAALQVYYNQEDLGVLGIIGEVVNRVYTVEGIATPTPSPTPTASPTPRASPTPSPTVTGALTPTPPDAAVP